MLLRKQLLLLQILRVSSQNYQHLKDVIKYLNRVHDYETVTIFICEELWPDSDSLFPLLGIEEESSMKPKLVISRHFSREIKMGSIFNGSPLSVVLANNHTSNILELATALLRGVRRNPIIFYVQHAPDNLQDNLKRYCKWTETTQFVNSLVLFNDSHKRYGCEMYPHVEVVDQTQWSTSDLLSNSPKHNTLDFKGKFIRLPVAEDKPRAFTVSYDADTKRLELSGLCWKVYKNYVEHSNGRVHPYPLYAPGEEYKSINDILDMVENKTIVCPANCWADLDTKRFSASYPIQIVDWCFLLPVIGKVPNYEYILKPFRSDTRLSLIAAIIVTGGVFWILGGYNSFLLGLLNSLNGYIALPFCTNVDG